MCRKVAGAELTAGVTVTLTFSKQDARIYIYYFRSKALALFFYDGFTFRNDIIDSVMTKLYDLLEAVKRVWMEGGFDCRAIGVSGHRVFYLRMKEMERIRRMFI